MSIRDIRLKMESVGNLLVRMKAIFTNENVIDKWNNRKIIPLAMAYHVILDDGQTAVIESMFEMGYRVTIGAVSVDCNFIRRGVDDRLSLMGYDNLVYATVKVRTKK